MDNEYYCKYCGDFHAALSFSFLTLDLATGVCSKSPNGRHQPYTGTMRGREGYDRKGRRYGKNRYYYCTYCGHPHIEIARLTAMPCARSPTGYHQPYEGEDKPRYVCKYCGSFSRSIEGLTRGSCSASPNKHHQPAE
jgi:hypothetical protein